MRHLILKIKESGMPYECSRSCLETNTPDLSGIHVLMDRITYDIIKTKEEGEQFEYMYRLFFFVF